MKRRLIPLALILVFLLLAGCGEKELPVESPSPSPEPTVTAQPPTPTPAPPTPSPTPEPVDELTNPLTGLPMEREEQTRARPIAVMLNNIYQALPQQGNSQADIIYECVAEGGVTRMIGVYQSIEGVGKVGSIRSARPYYLELALGLDAIYMHAGGSDEAYRDIVNWGVTAVDCVRTGSYGAVLWRDQDRVWKNGVQHSVITSGEAIVENFPKYSFRLDHEDDWTRPYTFAADGTPVDGEEALKITVPYSDYKVGVFTYAEDRGEYLVEEYGGPFLDGNTGEQLSFTNVLVIRAEHRIIDDYGRMEVDLSGWSGDGWFACGGKYIPITWKKRNLYAPITYFTEDGEELALGVGKSYVNIIPSYDTITVE